jgi:hypothetical protein
MTLLLPRIRISRTNYIRIFVNIVRHPVLLQWARTPTVVASDAHLSEVDIDID